MIRKLYESELPRINFTIAKSCFIQGGNLYLNLDKLAMNHDLEGLTAIAFYSSAFGGEIYKWTGVLIGPNNNLATRMDELQKYENANHLGRHGIHVQTWRVLYLNADIKAAQSSLLDLMRGFLLARV